MIDPIRSTGRQMKIRALLDQICHMPNIGGELWVQAAEDSTPVKPGGD